MKQKVLIELIINNQCNKRCEYCDLDFRNKSFSKENLDMLISFLQDNCSEVEYFYINFFGGEPLLSYDEICYFVSHVGIDNIQYSVGTNGVFLDAEKLAFFKKHNFSIYLSVDTIDGYSFLKDKDFFKYRELFQINFINDPDFLYNSVKTFDLIVEKGFQTINFMPVLSTKKWTKDALVHFGKVRKYVAECTDVKVNYFSYYNGFSSDTQFILDTDLCFYQDLDSLIWLQKQYSILPESLKNELDNSSRLFHLDTDSFTFKELLNSYNQKEVFRLIMKIPKVLGNVQTNTTLERIIKG